MLIVSQIGAREHYSVPAMAHRSGSLARLITDFWNPLGVPFIALADKLGSTTLSRMATRRTDHIPWSKVRTTMTLDLGARLRPHSITRYQQLLSSREQYARSALKLLDVEHDAFFGYSTESLDLLLYERRLGNSAVLGQVDAARVHYDVVHEEQQRHPKLALDTAGPPEAYFLRQNREWDAAHRIIVNSVWSRDALVAQGVSPRKLSIVPLAFEPTWHGIPPSNGGRRPLKVLWLGRLSLAKGFAYALQAAALLVNAPIEFTFIGLLSVRADALSAPSNSRILLPIPRSQTARWYSTHDVFLFPTLSDGFGITQLEAMSHGLPTIATTCCGEVVQHNQSGLLVRTRSPEDIRDALLRFIHEPELLPRMSLAARLRAQQFHPSRIWQQYANALFERKELPTEQ